MQLITHGRKRLTTVVHLLGMLAVVAGVQSATKAADLLSIGSPAPGLEIEHWIQDGEGRFPHVGKFEKGKVYVVEFWATWCGPCIQAMPHIVSMQKQFESKGVQFISISDEPLGVVNKFLDKPFRGAVEPGPRGGEPGEAPEQPEMLTYRDLTKPYSLTTDPDQSTHAAYPLAAMQDGIPVAFLVGKTGLIEWIGHPMQLAGPLSAVVADKWPREQFAKQFQSTQLPDYARNEVGRLLEKGEEDAAIKRMDEILKQYPMLTLAQLKLNVLLVLKRGDAAKKYIGELGERYGSDPAAVAQWTWMIYDLASNGMELAEELLDLAYAAAQKARPAADDATKANLIDTLAHIHAHRGELAKALELERQAVKLAGDDEREFIEAYLEELENAAKAIKQANQEREPAPTADKASQQN
ncbi:MAG: TlpA disulfide reductase family protein [Aureliella sp.]